MKQRVSLITLGTGDLGRARRFYEALGWSTGAGPDDDVVFFQLGGGMVLALWDRARLAEDSCVEDGGGWGGVTLALNFGSPAEVDATIEEARRRGRRSAASRPKPSGVATAASSSTPTAIPGRSPTTRTGRSPRTAASSLATDELQRAHLNLIDSSRQFFELDPDAAIEAEPGWLFGAGSATHPVISNAAFRRDDAVDAGEFIARANEFFAAQGSPLQHLGEGRAKPEDDDLAAAAEAAGFQAVYEMPEMVLGQRPEPPEPRPRGRTAQARVARTGARLLARRDRVLRGHRLPARGLLRLHQPRRPAGRERRRLHRLPRR